MTRRLAAKWFLVFLPGLPIALVASPAPDTPPSAYATQNEPRPERTVFLGGDLSDEALIVFTAAFAASGHPGVLLLDEPKAGKCTRAFLEAFQAEQVIPVGSFPAGVGELERRLGRDVAPVLPWKRGPPLALWKVLFP